MIFSYECFVYHRDGFDLRLGLPTGYPDFLKYYESQEPKYNPEVKDWKERFFTKMRQKEENGNTEWRDLEKALGEFSSEFEPHQKEDFRNFYFDINASLLEYLKTIELSVEHKLDKQQSHQLKEDLGNPVRYLKPREGKICNWRFFGENWNIDIISFNYTSTFEELCTDEIVQGEWYIRSGSEDQSSFSLRSIHHLHGQLAEDTILLGVDNIEQIANQKFRQDADILDVLVKPQSNLNYGTLTDDACVELIDNATLICFFGTSLGLTDKTWWTRIGNRFLADPFVTLLYFLYSPSERPILKTDASLHRKTRTNLLEALGIEDDEANYQDRIFIAPNTEMFPKGETQV